MYKSLLKTSSGHHVKANLAPQATSRFVGNLRHSPLWGYQHATRPNVIRNGNGITLGTRHMSWQSWKRAWYLWGLERDWESRPTERKDDDKSTAETKAQILEDVMRNRQPADLKLRCTILDAEGNVKTSQGNLKRSDICVEHHLNPRDLRKIDSRVPNVVPTILIRKEAILINILHIRALVKADAVILFDTYGSRDTTLKSALSYHLGHNLKSKTSNIPYEFRAIESILLSVLQALEAEMVFVQDLSNGLLSELEHDINHQHLKQLLDYSRQVASFKNRATLVGKALEDLLAQDEDLASMYLSDKLNNTPREETDHEELEVLLEFFANQVEEVVNSAESIEANMQSTQEIVELILDANRNKLLALDLKVSICTFGVGSGALLAGLFGMNLTSTFEQTPYAFYVMSAIALGVSAGIAIVGHKILRAMRRVGIQNRLPQLPRRKDNGIVIHGE